MKARLYYLVAEFGIFVLAFGALASTWDESERWLLACILAAGMLAPLVLGLWLMFGKDNR